MLPLVERILCPQCEVLFRGTKESKGLEPHHSSIESAVSALQMGCHICTSMWDRLPEEYHYDPSKGEGSYKVSQFHRYYGTCGRLETYKALRVTIDVFPAQATSLDTRRFEFALEPLDAIEEKYFMKNPGFFKDSPGQTISTKEALMSRAFYWYNDCKTYHEKCSNRARPLDFPGPTRLIEIDMLTLSSWKLIDDAAGLLPKVPYASLSHCWGRKPLLQLTSKTMAEMKIGMPFSSLPKTFQDAMVVAKHLDIRYIWIDSLCIVQDSVEDWQRESSIMKDVYMHAEINIAATAASQGSDGCLSDRASSHVGRKLWTVPVEWGGAGGRECLFLDVDDLKAQIVGSPLNRRAWVVQERIMAPKRLHLGRKQLFWECQETFACEDWPKGIPTAFLFSLGQTFSALEWRLNALHDIDVTSMAELSPFARRYANGHGRIYFFWTHMVELYTSCGLTFGDDKLVALSGLAKLFRNALRGEEYLSGIWRRDMEYQLLWKALRPQESAVSRAPSWSWASLDTDIQHTGRRYAADNDLILIQILDARTRLRTKDPTGQVSGGTLCVKGLLVQGRFNGHGIRNQGRLKITSNAMQKELAVNCWLDVRQDFDDQMWYFPIRQQIHRKTKMLHGLILKAHEGSKFTRAGYWEMFMSDDSASAFQCFGIDCQNPQELGGFASDALLRTIIVE